MNPFSSKQGIRIWDQLGSIGSRKPCIWTQHHAYRPKRINNLAHPLLFRDQGVGGSNPLSPTILSLTFSIIYAALAAFVFAAFFGTFGTTEGSSKPKPHCSAHFLRNATSSLILS